LTAYKEGFLAGCKPMICGDACFMKGKWGGQLHAAVARDANDNINDIQFKYYLEVIRGMDQRAYNYLEKVGPKMWSRHAFRTSSSSDILLNNIVGSFNAWVLEVRDKSILTCLETIRRQLMNRFDQKKDWSSNFN
jgi:hypothetical protein